MDPWITSTKLLRKKIFEIFERNRREKIKNYMLSRGIKVDPCMIPMKF
jgi:hypothetical protein